AALGKAMFKMKDNPNGMKWWWHSHVNMNVFWSGVDMSTIRGLGQQSWITATVFNKKAEKKSAFYQLSSLMGMAHEMFIDDIPTSVQRYYDPDVINQWEEEFKETVKDRKFTSNYHPTSYVYGNYYERGNSVHNKSASEKEDEDFRRAWERESDNDPKLLPPHSPGYYNGVPIDHWDEEGWMWDSKTQDYRYNPAKDQELNDAQQWEEAIAL